MKNSDSIPLIYGLIGYPIKHSLSPAMHNVAFKKLKINAVYILFEKQKKDFAIALRQMKLMNIRGFNVTVPYKEEIIPYLDELKEEPRQIGAVNTVLNQNGRFIGYNTDAGGFIASLKNDLKFEPQGNNVFIIGSGGAARAIGFALAKEKARSIIFYDIAAIRAKKLADAIKKNFPACSVSSVDSAINYQLSTINLLVNASTCGMNKSDPLPIDPKLLPRTAAVYDIIYNPSPTGLIKAVKARGMRGVGGLGMLLYQGALSFEIWTNRKAPLPAMRRALLKALNGKFY